MLPRESLFELSLRRDGSVADSMAADRSADVCHDEEVSSERTLRRRGESEEGIAMGMRSEACL